MIRENILDKMLDISNRIDELERYIGTSSGFRRTSLISQKQKLERKLHQLDLTYRSFTWK